ncbi:MAG: formyltransferase family protein [Candidatus Promineifilaceae bacterium]
MSPAERRPDRPIRVVVFGGGPRLERGPQLFIQRLMAQPEIELLAVFCQSSGRGLGPVARDLWRRRRLLALPLLLMGLLEGAGRLITHPRRELNLRRQFRTLAGRLHFVADTHAPAVLAEVLRLRPDLGLIYGSPILRPELFELPRQGTLGIHHGALPKYRGKKTTFWALYQGEERAGVTIQRVNAGLDTGQIVMEGSVAAGGRSLGRVWRELEALGLDLYIRAILAVRDGTAVFGPQSGPRGRLYRDPRLRDLVAFQARRWRLRPGEATTPTEAPMSRRRLS